MTLAEVMEAAGFEFALGTVVSHKAASSTSGEKETRYVVRELAVYRNVNGTHRMYWCLPVSSDGAVGKKTQGFHDGDLRSSEAF